MIAAVINVDLNLKISPRNFVAGFAQSPPGRSRPECSKLLRAQPNLAFFSRCRPPDLECKESCSSFFAQADVPPARFVCQIALGDLEMPRAQDLHGQSFDQKFSLDLSGRNMMRPAHGVDSNASWATRQQLFAEKIRPRQMRSALQSQVGTDAAPPRKLAGDSAPLSLLSKRKCLERLVLRFRRGCCRNGWLRAPAGQKNTRARIRRRRNSRRSLNR